MQVCRQGEAQRNRNSASTKVNRKDFTMHDSDNEARGKMNYNILPLSGVRAESLRVGCENVLNFVTF